MSPKSLTMIATGELELWMSEPSPEFYFELVAPTFKKADLVVAHLEVAHTDRPPAGAMAGRLPPPIDNLRSLLSSGISAVTFAGNAATAYGIPGIVDTLDWLNKHNFPQTGVGMNIDEARRPMILKRDGTRFGFLSYNCVSNTSWGATHNRPGGAYVDIITHHEPTGFPGNPPKTFTFPERWSLEAMREDIRALRPNCDVLSVALHVGGARTEIVLQDYEFEVPYAAIDAGADLIIGNHTHALRGVSFYKGKPIFHCLCNLVCAYSWEDVLSSQPEPETTLTKSRLRRRDGFSTRSGWKDLETMKLEYPYYPYLPYSRKGIIAKLIIEGGKISRVSYLPLLINKKSQPEILKHDERGQEVFDYMEKITREEGINTRYEWDGDEVIIMPG